MRGEYGENELYRLLDDLDTAARVAAHGGKRYPAEFLDTRNGLTLAQDGREIEAQADEILARAERDEALVKTARRERRRRGI